MIRGSSGSEMAASVRSSDNHLTMKRRSIEKNSRSIVYCPFLGALVKRPLDPKSRVSQAVDSCRAVLSERADVIMRYGGPRGAGLPRVKHESKKVVRALGRKVARMRSPPLLGVGANISGSRDVYKVPVGELVAKRKSDGPVTSMPSKRAQIARLVPKKPVQSLERTENGEAFELRPVSVMCVSARKVSGRGLAKRIAANKLERERKLLVKTERIRQLRDDEDARIAVVMREVGDVAVPRRACMRAASYAIGSCSRKEHVADIKEAVSTFSWLLREHECWLRKFSGGYHGGTSSGEFRAHLVTAFTTAGKNVVQQARTAVCRFDAYLATNEWADLNSRTSVPALVLAEFLGVVTDQAKESRVAAGREFKGTAASALLRYLRKAAEIFGAPFRRDATEHVIVKSAALFGKTDVKQDDSHMSVAQVMLIEELALGEFTWSVLGRKPILELSEAAIDTIRSLALTIRCSWRTVEARRAQLLSIARDGLSADCKVTEGGKARRKALSNRYHIPGLLRPQRAY
mmetsp:Transcript_10417/g.13636  ORF Transcript_10417/g.13636 Transcript_10417/m.13636 type:complete len:518 (+) Transcript_10417:178-1731(+)